MSFTIKIDVRPYTLINQIQHYAWGTRGKDAFIPKLLGLKDAEDKPYAELWMGAHPKAPSEVVVNNSTVSLRDLISRHPREILGEKVAEKFSGELPFLFKVLSAAEPLSIQAHPNKEQARYLHEKDPINYPDANHKPEIAVALGPFTALVGFKTVEQIASVMKKYPEIATYIGSDRIPVIQDSGKTTKPADILKKFFSALIERSLTGHEELLVQVERLKKRLLEKKGDLAEEERLFLELSEKYDDIGLFALFFLNLVHLENGEGIFLDAGIPHAYVRGNIIECMANSDNVVRVGLTPKHKDAETLLNILKYEPGKGTVLAAEPAGQKTTYNVPADEFRVTRYTLSAGETIGEESSCGVEIWLIVSGTMEFLWKTGDSSQNLTFRKGDSFLVPGVLEAYQVKASEPAEAFKVDVPV